VTGHALAYCKMLLIVRSCHDRFSQFWTSPSEEEERKKNILAVWHLSGSVYSWCLFTPLRILLVMKHSYTWRWIVCCH